MQRTLLFALIPVIAAFLGASVAALWPPAPKWRSAIQHFAAGVVFSVVAVELLPDVMRKHRPLFVVAGFVLGVIGMLALRSVSQKLEAKSEGSERGVQLPLLAAVGTDILIDGFLLGTVFRAGTKGGMLLSFALAAELVSIGMATAATLGTCGLRRRVTIALTTGIAAFLLVGAGVGDLLLARVSDATLEIVLSFGLAALLFLVTEELLVEAHEVAETPWITAAFFGGFLLFLVLGMVV